MASLAVFTDEDKLQTAAQALAARLQLPCCFQKEVFYDFFLVLTSEHLSLQKNGDASHPLYIDFLSGKMQHRRKHATTRNELLIRALGLKKQAHSTILDATAGLGRDSFLLASLGFTVISLERSPIVFELLKDGLQRAAQDLETSEIISRITLLPMDAVTWLKTHSPIDIIYLDPMFPERKKSALVKKDMQFFHSIVGEDVDAVHLLETALTCASNRVVVKRPRLAPLLGNLKPSFTLSGSSSRFDVYLG